MTTPTVITSKDFMQEGRSLNLSSFTNIEKSMSEVDFKLQFCNKNYEVYTPENINTFLSKLSDKTSELTKAEGSEDKVKDVFEKAIVDIKSLKRIAVDNGKDINYFLVRVKAPVIEKGEEIVEELSPEAYSLIKAENPTYEKSKPGFILKAVVDEDNLEKAEGSEDNREVKNYVWVKSDNLEKAEGTDTIEKAMFDSFRYGMNTQSFKKTGKDIKTKLAALKTKIEAKKTAIGTEMTNTLDKIEDKPTEKLGEYNTNGDETLEAMRVFNWNQTCYNSKSAVSEYSAEAKKSIAYAATQEEADLCRKYNDLVYQFMRVYTDAKLVGVYERNLEEGKTYDLNLDQIKELGF